MQIESAYVIQVVEKETGRVVEWAPGQKVEREFVTDLCNRVAAKGVGIFRTTDHVTQDVHDALHELLFELKSEV